MRITYAILNKYVPYIDKVLPANTEKKSKGSQKARKDTAMRIQHAVNTGKIDPSFAKIADNMKANAQKNLSESNYQANEYMNQQLSKLTPILNFIAPAGAGIIAGTVSKAITVRNLGEFAKESHCTKDIVVKLVKTTLPIIAGAAFQSVKPHVKALVNEVLASTPTPVIVGVAATVITTIGVYDAYDAYQNESKSHN